MPLAVLWLGAVSSPTPKKFIRKPNVTQTRNLSEETIQLALDAAEAGTWESAPRTGEFYASERALLLHGFPPGTPMNHERALEAVHPEDRARVLAAVEETLATGAPFRVELRAMQSDGSFRWLVSQAVRQGTAENPRLVGLVQDIHERKAAEEALKASEAKYRALAQKFEENEERFRRDFDAAGVSSWEWDIPSDDIRWSRSLERYLGIHPDSFRGGVQEFLALVHPQDRERVLQTAMRAIREGAEYHIELRMVRPDGEIRWIETRGVAVSRDAQGNPTKMRGIDMDITARKRAEEELRLTRERFEVALRGTPITVFQQDRELRFTWLYNPTSGYDPAGVIGKRDSEFMERSEDAAFSEAVKAEVLRTGKSWRGEISAHMNGVLYSYDTIIEPLRDASGEIVGINCACVDVTERKQLAVQGERLARQRQLALDAAKMGWWHFDPATKSGTWDDTFKKIYGLAANSGASDDVLRVVHPDDRERAWSELMAALDPVDPKPVFTEYRILCPDGSLRWVEVHGLAEFQGEGAARYAVSCGGTARDITERKAIAESMRAQSDRAEFVADASDVGFWFCDLPFDKLIWDKRVKNHFWLPQEADVTIGLFYECIHPEDRERTRLAIDAAIANDTQYDIEYRTVAEPRHQNAGAEKWIRAIGRTFYDASGKPTRFDGITMDVTARKQAEEALRASEARYRVLAETLERQVQARTSELQERNQQVLRMYESLRTLSSRLLQVQDEERRRIARDLHDSAGQLLAALSIELATLTADIQKSAPHLAEQAKGPQDLLRQLHQEIRTTSYLLHPPLLDEAGLFSALSWYVEGVSVRSGVQIQLAISESFGRLPRDLELVVFRLVQESLTNIHRHSDSKTGSIRITRERDAVSVEIRDAGRGISPERLAAIQTGGSGVGIRGMRERLHHLRGDLRIESSGAGTQVFATIPIPLGSDEEESRPLSEAV
jgi:PAS domain S-box-containing protein